MIERPNQKVGYKVIDLFIYAGNKDTFQDFNSVRNVL